MKPNYHMHACSYLQICLTKILFLIIYVHIETYAYFRSFNCSCKLTECWSHKPKIVCLDISCNQPKSVEWVIIIRITLRLTTCMNFTDPLFIISNLKSFKMFIALIFDRKSTLLWHICCYVNDKLKTNTYFLTCCGYSRISEQSKLLQTVEWLLQQRWLTNEDQTNSLEHQVH